MNFPGTVVKPLKLVPRTAQPFPTYQLFRLTSIQKPCSLTEMLESYGHIIPSPKLEL